VSLFFFLLVIDVDSTALIRLRLIETLGLASILRDEYQNPQRSRHAK
jgi:hypothetical protein